MELVNRNEFSKAAKLNKFRLDALSYPLMRLLKLDQVNKIYENNSHLNGSDFIASVLDELDIRIEIEENDLLNIPQNGAFITISNHPFGGIDGLILLKILSAVRPDFKVMANFMLHRVKNIQEQFIAVNPFEGQISGKSSLGGLRKSIERLQKGHPIGIFPAGEVSSFDFGTNRVIDSMWSPSIGKFIQKAQAPVIPVYFSGSNSTLFNVLGLVHPNLRTLKLPSELFNKKGSVIRLRIGKAISPKSLSDFENSDKLLRYLRARTYALGAGLEVKKYFNTKNIRIKEEKPIVAETPAEKIITEIASLRPSDDLLFTHQEYEIYAASSWKIPHVLREIGRLRELTFRAVGEGTNQESDRDEFDLYYEHLFMWDSKNQKIAGAYRIGKGKEIFDQYQKKGFYLNSLFRMSDAFIPYLKNSLELGRSFVVKEYQQKHLSLFLLWKGIICYLQKHPNYQYLIGPVSISNSYSNTSKALMIDMIQQNYFDDYLAKMVMPRKKFSYQLKSFDKEILIQKSKDPVKTIDELVGEIEPKGYKIPVLLKKYLKQKAKIIAFNIDPKFSNALDGFMVMQVDELPEETIAMLKKVG